MKKITKGLCRALTARLIALPLVLLTVSAIPAAEQTAAQDVKREGNGKKMGLYTFDLPFGDNVPSGGLLGGPFETAAYLVRVNDAMPYITKLRMKLIAASEDVLKGNDAFQYVPTEKLVFVQADKLMPLKLFIQTNDLYASLRVKTILGISIGWNKKVNMTTVWKLANSSGYEVTIKTSSKSQNAHGMSPAIEDPKLESVWLDLGKENARQFLDQLAAKMKEDKKF